MILTNFHCIEAKDEYTDDASIVEIVKIQEGRAV